MKKRMCGSYIYRLGYIYESFMDKEKHEEAGKLPEKGYLCDYEEKERRERWRRQKKREGGFDIYNQHIMDVYI